MHERTELVIDTTRHHMWILMKDNVPQAVTEHKNVVDQAVKDAQAQIGRGRWWALEVPHILEKS